MKALISDRLRYMSASLKSDLKKSDTVKKTIVFLGGECSKGNEWRDEIKKEYKDKIFFLDPYSESWKADENIYHELEGLLKSDYVVFYKGGEGTKKEKKFLDSVGGKGYKTFNSLKDLSAYLTKISKPTKKERKEFLKRTLRSIVSSIEKESYPWSSKGDLKFELIDPKDLPLLVDDLKKGEVIKVSPEVGSNAQMKGMPTLLDGKKIIEDSIDNGYSVVFDHLDKFHNPNPSLYYDSASRTIYPIKKTAKIGQEYSFCSTQVDLPEGLADKVMAWGKKIPDAELYVEDDGGCGREDEIHATLLYGLKDNDPSSVEKVLKGIKPFEVALGTITAFLDNDKHDVLKIDVDSPEMQKLHYMLEDNLPNENSYPTYHPHVTIAYLKKGEAEKYIGSDDFRGKKFKTDKIIFSSKSGDKIPIKLEE